MKNCIPCQLARMLLALALLPLTPLSALTLEQALSLAEQQAPSLQSWRLQQQAARSEVQAAGQLPDPRLSFGLQNVPIEGDNPGRLDADNMSMQSLGLTQEVPNRDRRSAQRDLAEAAELSAGADYQVERLEVRLGIAEVWLRLHGLEQQLALFDAFYQQNDLLATAIAARLSGGQGTLAEQPVAAIERAQLEYRHDQLRSQREGLQAASRRWLGEQAISQTQGNWPQWPLDESGWRQRLEQQQLPQLARYQPLQQESAAALRLAQADLRPDWSWGLAYQRRGMGLDDMVSVQLSIDLPVFPGRRQQPRIAARELQLAAVQQEQESWQRRLAAELAAELSEYHRLTAAVARSAEQMLPLAEQRADLAMADYRSGRGSLDALAVARSARTEAQLAHVQWQTERALSHARLQLTWGDN
ncbi:TolC family protein [Halopseudomonas salegens]|uniref:Outer membrane protein TolC n=1 Tax=Halopseudomonas salegens TaxID=1434072 RepID=A0A1H2DYW6_9GAMM|nr:TolC family protein [Halopseudomonas salegens]SDT88042.1 Outer membrane protein TolC [Halopseudomonas salegens]